MRNTSAVTPAIVHTDDETLFRSLRSYGLEAPSLKPETEHEEKTKNKLILPAVGIGSLVLLAVMVGVIYHATHLTTTAVVTHPVQTEEIVNAPQKPSPVTLPAPVQPAPQPAAPVVRQQSTNPGSYQPAPHVESDLMADQLTEPTRIPSDIKKVQPKETPPAPGFGVPGMDGLGSGAIGSVFSGPGKPKQKVEPSKVVSISAGVAVGLLLQKTNPVYPPIAKAARVAGTVELQATISKSGTIENLRVVSGPDMLRQSAMDAVRSWRYRPYKLNNEPVEVETTVDVIFALGR
jgi:protein TonB